jgi:hypothetical protein
MAFRVDIQKAPERQGRASSAGWAGASADPTLYGTYLGPETDTLTLTVATGGTIDTTATMSITWAWASQSDTGTLNVGTDDYSGGDVIALTAGMSISFPAAGTLVATDTCAITCTAATKIVGTPVVVTGDADPTDVQIPSYARGDMHVSERTWDGREKLGKRANTGRVSLLTDYLDDTNRDKLLYLKDTGAHVCVGENYNEDTLFLFHGGGATPFIGDFASFTRSGGNATYPDARTGLWKHADANVARVAAGQAGRAVMIEQASTNLFPNSVKDTPGDDWVTSGSATISYDTTVFGPFDPNDDDWNSDHTGGCPKVEFGAAAANINHNDVTISSGAEISGSVWVRGFGQVTVAMRTGVGAAGTVKDSELVQLDSSWYRVELSAVSGGSDNRGDLRIYAEEAGVCYFWGWQLEETPSVSGLIQTSGGSGSRNADSMTFSQAVPVESGTISFWMYWPGTPIADTFTLFDTTGTAGTEDFRLSYLHNPGAGCQLKWWLGSGTLTGLATVTEFADRTWHHIVATWAEGATAGQINLKFYHQGSALTMLLPVSPGDTANWKAFYGTGFTMGVGDAAVPEQDIHGFRVEELRIDKSAMSAADVTDQYNRLTSDDWAHIHRAHAGRKYRIVSCRDHWLHTSQPDKVIMNLELEEVDREDDSVIIPDSD